MGCAPQSFPPTSQVSFIPRLLVTLHFSCRAKSWHGWETELEGATVFQAGHGGRLLETGNATRQWA